MDTATVFREMDKLPKEEQIQFALEVWDHALPREPWWEKIRGDFKDDADYDEAMRLGRAWRESFQPDQE